MNAALGAEHDLHFERLGIGDPDRRSLDGLDSELGFQAQHISHAGAIPCQGGQVARGHQSAEGFLVLVFELGYVNVGINH